MMQQDSSIMIQVKHINEKDTTGYIVMNMKSSTNKFIVINYDETHEV
jgi:hypothetical protein